VAVGFALILALLLAHPALADAPHAAAACEPDHQPKPVTDAWVAMKRDPNSLATQLGLVDALIDQGCYRNALPILQAGLAQRPRSTELQSRMRAVRSMLNEEQFFAGLGNAQETAKLQHNLLRCTKLADVSACDEALRSKPDDPQLMIAKGDALLHDSRPAEALLTYRHAADLFPDERAPEDQIIKQKLAAAESQRQALVSQCQGTADAAAVTACQAALLQGSSDESALLQRKGIVLQSLGKPEQALDAFIAAEPLNQDDKSVALAIVALTSSMGRKDALALGARGSALLTLGRPAEALPALQQAEALAPALPGIKAQLARAEHGAQEEAKRQGRLANARANAGAVKQPHGGEAAAAGAGAATSPPAPAYSNDASPGHTN